jgi:DNA-binding transcriptional MerR regulator
MSLTMMDAERLTGLAASAIRYYEDQGLFLPDRKNGRRVFDKISLAQLSLLNDLRLAGMTLADIRDFQSQQRSASATCENLAKIAAGRAAELRQQIKAMRLAEERLRNFASGCTGACGSSSASSCNQIGLISAA